MKTMIGIWLSAVLCVAIGIAALIFDLMSREPSQCRAPSQCRYETWTDESTGHRFLVVTPRGSHGVGVCLIPSFAAEEKEDNGVPEPKTIESVVNWPERN